MANNFKTTIELSAQAPSGSLLYTTLELPATRGEITDAAHRLRNLPVSEIVITESDALPELVDTRPDAILQEAMKPFTKISYHVFGIYYWNLPLKVL